MSQAVAPLMYIRALWEPPRGTDLSVCYLWASTMSQLPILLASREAGVVQWSPKGYSTGAHFLLSFSVLV